MGKLRVPDLAKSALADTTEENEVEEVYFSIKVYGLEITACVSFLRWRWESRREDTSGRQQTPPMCVRDYKMVLGSD